MRNILLLTAVYFLFQNAALHAQNNKGIGIQFARDAATGKDTVGKVIAGNAAADAGLRAGDEMIEIGGKELSQLTNTEVITLLKGGKDGAPYTLKIRRRIQTTLGEKTKELELHIVPREVSQITCISGDCKNGTGNLMDNTTGIRREGQFKAGDFVSGKTSGCELTLKNLSFLEKYKVLIACKAAESFVVEG